MGRLSPPPARGVLVHANAFISFRLSAGRRTKRRVCVFLERVV